MSVGEGIYLDLFPRRSEALVRRGEFECRLPRRESARSMSSPSSFFSRQELPHEARFGL